jgi:hypothetical protein
MRFDILINFVKFQVLTAASMMFRIVFWDVLPCKKLSTDVSEVRAASIIIIIIPVPVARKLSMTEEQSCLFWLDHRNKDHNPRKSPEFESMLSVF